MFSMNWYWFSFLEEKFLKVRDENWSVDMKQKAREKKGAPPRDSVIKGPRTRPSRIPRSSPKTQKSHKSLEGEKYNTFGRETNFWKKGKEKIMPSTHWCREFLYYCEDHSSSVREWYWQQNFRKIQVNPISSKLGSKQVHCKSRLILSCSFIWTWFFAFRGHLASFTIFRVAPSE